MAPKFGVTFFRLVLSIIELPCNIFHFIAYLRSVHCHSTVL